MKHIWKGGKLEWQARRLRACYIGLNYACKSRKLYLRKKGPFWKENEVYNLHEYMTFDYFYSLTGSSHLLQYPSRTLIRMYIHWYVLNVHAVAVKEHYMLTMYQPYRQNNIETISHMAKRKKTIIVSSYLYYMYFSWMWWLRGRRLSWSYLFVIHEVCSSSRCRVGKENYGKP